MGDVEEEFFFFFFLFRGKEIYLGVSDVKRRSGSSSYVEVLLTRLKDLSGLNG